MPVNYCAPALTGMWAEFVPAYIIPWFLRWRCQVAISLTTQRLDESIDTYSRDDQAYRIRGCIRRQVYRYNGWRCCAQCRRCTWRCLLRDGSRQRTKYTKDENQDQAKQAQCQPHRVHKRHTFSTSL